MTEKLAALVVCLLVLAPPAHALTIRSDVFRQDGGTLDDPEPGFREHEALAKRFPGMAFLVKPDGDVSCSATYVGQEGSGALFLTAAHCFQDWGDKQGWVETRSGRKYQATFERSPELWPKDFRGDMAVVGVAGMDEDLGPAPSLYCGRREVGKMATVTGVGTQGTGDTGQPNDEEAHEDIEFGRTPLAGHNMIDALSTRQVNDNASTTGLLETDFDDGTDGHNALASAGSDADPVDRLEAASTQGDSGGSLWIEAQGGLAIAGVSSFGDQDARYGAVSDYARTSDNIEFLRSLGLDMVWGTDEDSCYDPTP